VNNEWERIGKVAVVTYSRYCSDIFLGRTEEDHKKISVRIAGDLAELRTEHVPNKRLEGYRFTSETGRRGN
jgi:hypothetical protein